MQSLNLNRRSLLKGAAIGGGALALQPWLPAWAQPVSAGLPTLTGEDIHLRVGRDSLEIDGKAARDAKRALLLAISGRLRRIEDRVRERTAALQAETLSAVRELHAVTSARELGGGLLLRHALLPRNRRRNVLEPRMLLVRHVRLTQ